MRELLQGTALHFSTARFLEPFQSPWEMPPAESQTTLWEWPSKSEQTEIDLSPSCQVPFSQYGVGCQPPQIRRPPCMQQTGVIKPWSCRRRLSCDKEMLLMHAVWTGAAFVQLQEEGRLPHSSRCPARTSRQTGSSLLPRCTVRSFMPTKKTSSLASSSDLQKHPAAKPSRKLTQTKHSHRQKLTAYRLAGGMDLQRLQEERKRCDATGDCKGRWMGLDQTQAHGTLSAGS